MGFMASVCHPSTLRMLIWPEASNTRNRMAAVSADGRPVWVLIRLVARSRYHVETSRLAARGLRSAERRAWRAGVYAIIAAMTSPQPQGELTVERMCMLAGSTGPAITAT
jgi:hypothetical protein